MPRKKKRNKKIIEGTLLATLGGAVLSAGALALSDKKVRKKLKTAVDNLEKEGIDKLDELINKVKKSRKKSEKRLSR
jgi:ATP-dependent protease HslVU (ClpYQ) peptidase subunit